MLNGSDCITFIIKMRLCFKKIYPPNNRFIYRIFKKYQMVWNEQHTKKMFLDFSMTAFVSHHFVSWLREKRTEEELALREITTVVLPVLQWNATHFGLIRFTYCYQLITHVYLFIIITNGMKIKINILIYVTLRYYPSIDKRIVVSATTRGCEVKNIFCK